MTRRRASVGLLAFLAPGALAFAACDDDTLLDRDTPRFNYPVDAPDEVALDVFVPPRDAAADVARDGAADADAGPPLVRALATGASAHPDPAVGNGDHTCVVAGPSRSLYCWGANDRGQIGNGRSGAGLTTEDVSSATKIALDETGLPLDGIEEIALAAFHACARKGDVAFCWGERFSGAQAEPPAAGNLERAAPRAIGNLDVVRLGAGGPHTCAVKTSGKVACFGHSSFGELGRPFADDPPCTAPVFAGYEGVATHQCSGTLVDTAGALTSRPTALALGEVHSCALVLGKVACWGSSASGELGRPGAAAAEPVPQIVTTDAALTPLDGVTAIAGDGARHTCALGPTGVACWGRNDVGQLGADPALVPSRAFAATVAGTQGAVAVGVAEGLTCVVRADATVLCWGRDLASLADAGVASSAFTPVPIKGPLGVGLLSNVAAVAPGLRHACALKKDGTVWCWGKNDRGQLGDGTKVDSPFPVKVSGLP